MLAAHVCRILPSCWGWAWKWQLEKKNHDPVPELRAYALTWSFSHASHWCGNDSLSPFVIYKVTGTATNLDLHLNDLCDGALNAQLACSCAWAHEPWVDDGAPFLSLYVHYVSWIYAFCLVWQHLTLCVILLCCWKRCRAWRSSILCDCVILVTQKGRGWRGRLVCTNNVRMELDKDEANVWWFMCSDAQLHIIPGATAAQYEALTRLLCHCKQLHMQQTGVVC